MNFPLTLPFADTFLSKGFTNSFLKKLFCKKYLPLPFKPTQALKLLLDKKVTESRLLLKKISLHYNIHYIHQSFKKILTKNRQREVNFAQLGLVTNSLQGWAPTLHFLSAYIGKFKKKDLCMLHNIILNFLLFFKKIMHIHNNYISTLHKRELKKSKTYEKSGCKRKFKMFFFLPSASRIDLKRANFSKVRPAAGLWTVFSAHFSISKETFLQPI